MNVDQSNYSFNEEQEKLADSWGKKQKMQNQQFRQQQWGRDVRAEVLGRMNKVNIWYSSLWQIILLISNISFEELKDTWTGT